MRLAGVNVPVNDMARAIAFYTEVFGCAPTVAGASYSLFEVEGVQLGLVHDRQEAAVASPLLSTGGLDTERERLGALGAMVGPVEVHDGYRIVLLTDPEGNSVEVYETSAQGQEP